MALSRPFPYALSLAGTHHGADPGRNEDALCFRKTAHYAALVLADGASSGSRSRQGAAWLAAMLAEVLTANGRTFFVAPPAQTAHLLLLRAQDHLRAKAAQEHCDPADFASTAVFFLYARRTGRVYYFSLGDSLPVVVAEGICTVPAPPEDSPAGTPVITTPDAAAYVRAGVLDTGNISALMVCSDGAWRDFYRRGIIRSEYAELLCRGDFAALAGKLQSTPHADDCSFLALTL